MQNTDAILLQNQICFPLYALSKEITKLYRPLLEALDITYPQYLVMMVLWEKDEQSVSDIGEKLSLDSGTLTPLLKRLESKSLINRVRNKKDERVVEISLTENGQNLKLQACSIPTAMMEKMNVDTNELHNLKQMIDALLIKIQNR